MRRPQRLKAEGKQTTDPDFQHQRTCLSEGHGFEGSIAVAAGHSKVVSHFSPEMASIAKAGYHFGWIVSSNRAPATTESFPFN